MAILKDLIVHGASHFIGKTFINDSHIAKINESNVPENPKFTDTIATGEVTGSGNGITDVSINDGNFSFTKGNFLTSQNTAALFTGTSSDTGNAATTNGNTYLILQDGNNYSRRKIAGTDLTQVTSNANGDISVSTKFANQQANKFFGGPSSGNAAAPNFREIELEDLPHDTVITAGSNSQNLPTTQAVAAYVDNIQIGGRNYLRNTKFFTGWINDQNLSGTGNVTYGEGEDEYVIINVSEGDENEDDVDEINEQQIITNEEVTTGTDVVAGDTVFINTDEGILDFPQSEENSANVIIAVRPNYNVNYSYLRKRNVTFSAEVQGEAGIPLSIMMNPFLSDTEGGNILKYTQVYLAFNGGDGSETTFTPASSDLWYKVSATVNFNDASFFNQGTSSIDYSNCFLGVKITRKTNNKNHFLLRRPKIEIGTEVTDWVPALEDNEVDSAEIGIKKNLFPSSLYQHFTVKDSKIKEKTLIKREDTGWCKVKEGKKYTISRRENTNTSYNFYFTATEPKNGTDADLFLSWPKAVLPKDVDNISKFPLKNTIEIPKGMNYIFVQSTPSIGTKRNDYNLKIEEGSNATGWEHYEADLITTPQMFGAYGDGIHDDTEALQKALNASNNVFLPKGIYLVNYPLIVNNSTHLYGIGSESKIKANIGFSKQNIPHGAGVSLLQNNIYKFMNTYSEQILGTRASYVLNLIDSHQAYAFGITSYKTSSFIFENFNINCNCNGTSDNMQVAGIKVLKTYDNGFIRGVSVEKTRYQGIHVGFPYSYMDCLSIFAQIKTYTQQQNETTVTKKGIALQTLQNEDKVSITDHQADANDKTFWTAPNPNRNYMSYKQRMLFNNDRYTIPEGYQTETPCPGVVVTENGKTYYKVNYDFYTDSFKKEIQDNPIYAELRFFDYFHNSIIFSNSLKSSSTVLDYGGWRKDGSRSQTLSISGCLFKGTTGYASATPLGELYNALETNLSDSKFLLGSLPKKGNKNYYHDQPCFKADYCTDIYVRGCSFTNGKYAIFLSNSCNYFRLIGNTYERIPKNNDANNYYASDTPVGTKSACIYVMGISGTDLCRRGIIIETPYSNANSVVKLHNAERIQVIGAITALQESGTCRNNALNSFLTMG